MLDEAKKKKPYSSVTYTTGDPKVNVDHFNKMLAGKEVNTHTDGYLNGTFKNSEAEKACEKVGTFASASPDGASAVSLGGGESSGGEGGCCESLHEGVEKYMDYIGKTIKIISIGDDPAADRYEGKTGIVKDVKLDGYGDVQLWGTWCGIAIYPDHDIIEIIDEPVTEATHAQFAKPEGDKVASYNNALAYANRFGKPFIYGYTNRRYNGKFFAFEQPIKCVKDIAECEKEFRNRYKDCGTVYIAYPNSSRADYSVKQNAFDEELAEQMIYVSKWDENVNIPDHIHVLNKNDIEAELEKLEPEEEFVVGYVTPIRFYSELDDKFDLVKCTELVGYTGIDYIEARADDAGKEKRIQIAKDTIALGSKNGIHLDRNPHAHKQGDFSANYVSTNKTVLQNNGNTLLFYPKVGSNPKVTYYLDLHNGNGFRKVSRDQLERIILNRVEEIADELETGVKKDGTPRKRRWDDATLAAKIRRQLETDAATISARVLDKEDSAETRSKLSNGTVSKPQVRALYTNQIYYLSTQHRTLGNFLTEDVDLQEAGGKKGRKVTRYYIKPHHIWCSKKIDILNALVDHPDEDCIVYTLIRLDDNKDITKLTNNDVIYYYEDGILYDKNHVKVMDYDLAVKHEEDRAKLNVETASDAQIEKVYHDRITGEMNEEIKPDHELDLEFDDVNVFGESLKEGKETDGTCCICGEEINGYGNNAEPVKSGRCCDACNLKFVIPARLEQIDNKEEN